MKKILYPRKKSSRKQQILNISRSSKKEPSEQNASLNTSYALFTKCTKAIKQWKIKTTKLLERIRIRGRQRLTIMIIPHTEKRILNFHLNVYAISGVITTIVIVMLISIISLVGKSGEDLTHYGMGLDNKQFKLQSLKMAEEMVPLHNIINEYTNTISSLFVKLDGNIGQQTARGGVSQAIMDAEIDELKELMNQCKENKESCDQDLTREMLRRVIFLSKQDNENLRHAIELSDSILKELKTKEKQNILKHTPSILPTRGYILSQYGKQIDRFLGREQFKRGIEIGALPGTEVYATAPGEVSEIKYDPSYGLYIKLKHRYGMRTYYAHLDHVKINLHDRVSKGEVIGYVGRSGNTPIYMLYYELHVGTIAYNPQAFLNHIPH